MKKPLTFSILVSILLLFNITIVTSVAQTAESMTSSKMSIPFILKTDALPYFKAMITGAKKASEDYDVDVLIEAPKAPLLTGLEEQISLFKNALTTTPQAIVLSALDSKAFNPYLEQAKSANIPVISLDADVTSPVVKTLVATDNYGIGELAAHKMAQFVGNEGKVAVIDFSYPIKSTSDRRDGFINTLNENYPNIEVLRIPYTPESFTSFVNYDALKEIIKKFIETNPDIKGIFATASYESEAAINAIKELNKIGQIKLIGSTSSKLMLDAIRENIMLGAVTPDAVNMGYQAVEAAVKAAKGEKLPELINTNLVWYDKSNMDNPKIKAVLYE